ncbi:MAG: type II toxin-antitoxin system MqsA family antitoxin [Desulfobacula sp.]|jgi:putative zinc finger/helix-turn-helix YgiT family protein|uniref:type II TA system antitoxin MqsA family protein n=1 Tax=Desulfobacula sp. TaxID=2593537 RepID=UPI001DD6D30F|nr:type II toxin-antitoxin system MqsA family antitoxin [Desulfobacula sp.]MBT3806328.1 type II toxin-antitoxin system MqsA family antitoxin [Desulfobacula sp.]MBT4024260.1 type II toxin-antitoxin system MqsA family antitoxin [Desulfobacula sp.]MBT4874694.1 type II toxin-antitoxin system MqsA family antitoxin [Desulfobacula sp.]MBT5543451.1 type II toxin-antitoxin system MqsA family antitoxin [Desulfobacula sp.]
MIQMNCPRGHGAMEKEKVERSVTFKGIEVNITEDAFVCPKCKLSAGTVQSAGLIQHTIAEAYRQQVGLLTGEEIKKLRKEKEMTQADLAKSMGVGVVSIKRWETGSIQTKSMDQSLRQHLMTGSIENNVNGNRDISIPRILLVLTAFQSVLKRAILKENDKMLFAAKYLFYADMLAKKMLGRSMTGAAYARLPFGPQLNNYNDLLDEIRNADISEAKDLTVQELEIIEQITRTFPEDRMVYDASHKEPAWLETKTGAPILYTWADRLIVKIN